MKVSVIGAGLAGCEAAWYLANKGVEVDLYEMRNKTKTPAHNTDKFAELVCSNSLRGTGLRVASGVLKDEMEMLNSVIIKAAKETAVKAGGALAVDREGFSELVTDLITNHKNINIINEEVLSVPSTPTIIATGPLTSDKFSEEISKFIGEEQLFFFDAAAPIIDADSINMDIVYLKSRYDKGEAAYLNCPMNEEEFNNFYNELIKAECVEPKDFELKVFEGCMPFEVMAKRGKETLTFGPMKPVGLRTPKGERPYAVVQLRQDDAIGSLYNIVGFQTHLKFGEQKRIIRMIPGLESAEIVRYGVMHKNTYINSPKILNSSYQMKDKPGVFFAGQITGVEGYVESAASGIVAGINMYSLITQNEPVIFPSVTITGSMAKYISSFSSNFQPINANFGIIPELGFKHAKKERKELYGKRALETMEEFIKNNNLL